MLEEYIAEKFVNCRGWTSFPQYLTCIAMDAIKKSRYIVGYKFTLDTVESVIDKTRQEVYHVTMQNQESTYQYVYNKMKDGEYLRYLLQEMPTFLNQKFLSITRDFWR